MRVIGQTQDAKKVVDGIWHMYETYGLPLDIIFDICAQRNFMPDWIMLYRQMRSSGMSKPRILFKLEAAISDTFGNEAKKIILMRLGQCET